MSTTTTDKRVQKIDSLEALLKTNNIFLFIPNIIGRKTKKDFLVDKQDVL